MAITSVRSFSSIVPSSTCDAPSEPVYSLNALTIFYSPVSLISLRSRFGGRAMCIACPIVSNGWPPGAHLSSEHAATDRGVEQQEWKDEEACPPPRQINSNVFQVQHAGCVGAYAPTQRGVLNQRFAI